MSMSSPGLAPTLPENGEGRPHTGSPRQPRPVDQLTRGGHSYIVVTSSLLHTFFPSQLTLLLSLFPSLSFLLFTPHAMHQPFDDPHSPLQSTMHPPVIVISKFRSQRKKHTRSQTRVSDGPWKSDTPFGPPQVSSFPAAGIRRIRNTLSKLSPAARAERELLRQTNRYKNPLTERNVNNFVSEQELRDIYYPTDNSTELQVTAWLEQLA